MLRDHVGPSREEEGRWLGTWGGFRRGRRVADGDGEAMGRAAGQGGTYRKTRHVGGIGIAIRDGWRGVGLGRMLMERILEWRRARGFKKAELAVFGTNGRARRLYESIGFVDEGSSRRHVLVRGAYEDAIHVGLWLQD